MIHIIIIIVIIFYIYCAILYCIIQIKADIYGAKCLTKSYKVSINVKINHPKKVKLENKNVISSNTNIEGHFSKFSNNFVKSLNLWCGSWVQSGRDPGAVGAAHVPGAGCGWSEWSEWRGAAVQGGSGASLDRDCVGCGGARCCSQHQVSAGRSRRSWSAGWSLQVNPSTLAHETKSAFMTKEKIFLPDHYLIWPVEGALSMQ